jgi:toxin ParE1/3/4
MSRRLYVSPTAESDLAGILSYIASDKPGAATKFVQRLRNRCESLAHHPYVGEDCSILKPKMRRVTYAGYLIFFRADDEKVEIIRVVHGARDWPELFS